MFPLLSPMVDSIKLVRRGKVRRAKLYYLRGRRGKSARIVEKQERQGYQTPPARPPLPGARYGSLAAGCSYADGSFVPAGSRKACPGAAPHNGADFSLWHPTLRTMRVWLWAPNPHGLFTRTNPSFSYESPLALAFDADAERR